MTHNIYIYIYIYIYIFIKYKPENIIIVNVYKLGYIKT